MLSTSDTRLTRESIQGLSDAERLWRLMEPGWGHEPGNGTHGQQVLALTTFFIRDVCNGGLDQAFHNFSPSAVEFILRSLDELEATEHAAAVRAGLHALFGPHPPETLARRQRLLETRSREWLDEHVEPLNKRLYNEERLEPYLLRYVESHPSEFFRD